jgi:hypothetical protein
VFIVSLLVGIDFWSEAFRFILGDARLSVRWWYSAVYGANMQIYC